MLKKEVEEAYKKIKPASDLQQRILANINEEKCKSQEKIMWNKPLMACASIIVLTFVIYCAVGLLDNRVLIYDINGNDISKTESVIPTFDINRVLDKKSNNDALISPMNIGLFEEEYISTILQLNIKNKSQITVEEGIIFVIDDKKNFIEVGKEFETDKSVPICWAFINTNNNFNTKMHIKSEKEENIINLKYENSTFSAYILK